LAVDNVGVRRSCHDWGHSGERSCA
jgi:hypothetical protein